VHSGPDQSIPSQSQSRKAESARSRCRCYEYRPGFVWRVSWWRSHWRISATTRKTANFRTYSAAAKKIERLRAWDPDFDILILEVRPVLRGRWVEISSGGAQ